MAEIRDDVLLSLVDHAMGDEDFRRKAQVNLDATLKEHGYNLTEEELGAVRDFHSQVVGLSDHELREQVADARRLGT